jgi:hypothetical protein
MPILLYNHMEVYLDCNVGLISNAQKGTKSIQHSSSTSTCRLAIKLLVY